MNGIEAFAKERQRHQTHHDWDAEHDDEHTRQELISAARCYVAAANWAQFSNLSQPMPVWARDNIAPWPWDEKFWKPSEDPQRNLEKAGALLAAEWDRLQRLIDKGDKA